MTRGKYANRAEKTAAIKETVSEVERLRVANVKLINENKELRQKLDDQAAVHADRVRTLTAQLREGVSDELAAARLEIVNLREDRAACRADRDRAVKTLTVFRRNVGQILADHDVPADTSRSIQAMVQGEMQMPTDTTDGIGFSRIVSKVSLASGERR